MISSRQRLAWAGLLASVAFAASAQTTPPPAAPAAAEQGAVTSQHAPHMRHGGDPAQRMEKMKAHRAQRLAELKTKLQLNASQESAWSTFAQSRQPEARPQRPDRDAFAKMTTPQRLDLMKERQASRTMAFERRADATRSFYATLSPEQQKTFDAETLKMGPHGGPRGHHGQPGHHGDKAAPTAS